MDCAINPTETDSELHCLWNNGMIMLDDVLVTNMHGERVTLHKSEAY